MHAEAMCSLDDVPPSPPAKPARASRETRLAFVPSKSAQADLEPRHSLPLGERRPRLQADLRRLGRPERLPRLAAGRPTYSSDKGLA